MIFADQNILVIEIGSSQIKAGRAEPQAGPVEVWLGEDHIDGSCNAAFPEMGSNTRCVLSDL